MKTILMTLAILLSVSSTISAKEFIFGTIFENKGENALTAQEAMNGAILAVKKFNETSPDLKIKLECETCTRDPLEIIKAVHNLSKTKGISAAVGIVSEDAALSAAPTFQELQLPFICSGAQLLGLTNSKTPDIFTLAVPDNKIGSDLAKYTISTLQADHIFLIRSDMKDSTAQQAESFTAEFTAKGGTILSELRITEPDPDLSYIMKAIKAFAPPPQSDSTTTDEAVGASDYSDSYAEIITQQRTAPPETQQIEAVVILAPAGVSAHLLRLMQKKQMAYNVVGGTSFDTVAIKKSIAAWSGTVIFASQASLTREDDLVTLFVKDYADLFGEKPQTGYAALGFDSILLLAETAGKTGNPSVNIRTNLPTVKNFQGVSGNISFTGGRAKKPLYIIQSNAGKISLADEM
ncbi:ABC transporter substrate-binding protein [Desulfovibrio gilichinskyi]|uniref:ABC-type branched-chain amino acid transport system, substrate-binding protein n=1 Tax=Desulfovibrio gilichinskyi TaxID=1519643 RepID=A0A1X7EUJ1_9BACT|nr:ABC transporter substrate-binding protein [Desulfovibrio gilichinskyi]SMF40187.1 ABC-type branched-chain amino acid transport system, substrate-binding protein [Desulfovibrio gilichinskyi]